MSRPGRIETLMRQAQAIADRSTCARAHVGAVIAHQGRVMSQGYNGAPAGMAHCNHACDCGGKGPEPDCVCPPISTLTTRGHWDFCELIYKAWETDDPHLDTCPAVVVGCRTAVHAEANAVAFAARYGVPTNGASLYTTLAPCLPCAQLIINAGIIRVYWLTGYRDDAGVELLRAAKVGVLPWSYPNEQTA
jgi:dCMP deaminase